MKIPTAGAGSAFESFPKLGVHFMRMANIGWCRDVEWSSSDIE